MKKRTAKKIMKNLPKRQGKYKPNTLKEAAKRNRKLHKPKTAESGRFQSGRPNLANAPKTSETDS